ncbi:MAG: hypothetical protein JRI23_35950 [Deltaproteobacteria bacterium]|jgi:hypothetical protein|nr:hypothetical protein [Deltaproteobacteria bacterium]MBW2537740.1 hypothetical protein [Deltaproteobacteria bacterium]
MIAVRHPPRGRDRWAAALVGAASAVLLPACGGDSTTPPASSPPPFAVVVTFNTGTSEQLGHDLPPDDGYGSEQALLSDQYYGDGLAWQQVVDDARAFFEGIDAEVVGFQEIFYSGECESIPAAAHTGFVCETWQPGARTVAEIVLGEGWQVACHLGKTDKCAAVRRSFGSFRGCPDDLCLDGLAGAEVDGCGQGSRIGRGVIDLVDGGELTLVNVHGSSGIEQADQDCRMLQFAQVFEDLGDGGGEPAANGERNVILGDLNTDPGRMADFDESAQLWNEHVGPDKRFDFITAVGPDAPASYLGMFDIDHVVSDAFVGSCWIAGVTEGHAPVSDVRYFDHKPIVCNLSPPSSSP